MTRQKRKENLTLSNIRPPMDEAEHDLAKAWRDGTAIFMGLLTVVLSAVIFIPFHFVYDIYWHFFLIPVLSLLIYFFYALNEYRSMQRSKKEFLEERARPLRMIEGVVLKRGWKTEDVQFRFFSNRKNTFRTVVTAGMEFEDEFGKTYT